MLLKNKVFQQIKQEFGLWAAGGQPTLGDDTVATANINVRTDAAIKAQAQQIFESMGLDLSTAVNLFLRQTVRMNNLPFVVGAACIRPDEQQAAPPQVRRKPMYGCAKDKIWISDDFDEPLDDFKEYT
jgi:DNA-damage-inducible protein J